MESLRLAFLPATEYPKPLKLKAYSPNLYCRTKTVIQECHPTPCHCWKILLVSGPATIFNKNITNNYPVSLRNEGEKLQNLRIAAAAVPASADDSQKKINLIKNLRLGGMFAIWYLLNIYFNLYNKQLGAIFLLAMGHTVGNLLTNISLGKVAVSFTHTIKAMEPFFTVVLSALVLGQKPSIWVVSSLVPIVVGVSLASFTEASFNWIGFGSAMASNLTNQTRNVCSKRIMVKDKETLDNINLYSLMTIISFLLLLPVAIALEGVKFSTSYFHFAASQGLNVKEFFTRALIAGLCFHSYQQVSYNILGMVSPVTHSVGNCVKRVVVIVSSVLFFQTPVSSINALGTGMALVGVFLYSRAKRIKSAPKTA